MARRRRIITSIFALVLRGCLSLGWSHLSAQDLKLMLDGDGLALTYTKEIASYVAVQLSTDLVSWAKTFPLDEIQSQNEGNQITAIP